MRAKILAAAVFALFALLSPNYARADNVPAFATCGSETLVAGFTYTLSQDLNGKLCVNATVNASVGGFVPSLSYTTLTATAASSASTALPTNSGTVAFQNQTAVAVSCTLASGAATALTNELIVPAGSTIFVGTTGYDHAACINQTGSASNVIILAGGTGLGTGFGGGGSGGGGGAVTVADGADISEGATTDAAATAGSTGSIQAKLRFVTSILNTISSTLTSMAASLVSIVTNTGAAIPAGSNVIGHVIADTGSTTAVTSLPATPAGTNTIGSVKQTDGTTVVVTDPCQGSTKSYLPITATTSLVKVIATGVSAKKIFICQLILAVTAADNVAVFEATTGTTCATSAIAVYGAGTAIASAANGFPFPANGGVSLGMGGFSIAQTTVNNNDLCIATSAATPLTGGIMYVTQ